MLECRSARINAGSFAGNAGLRVRTVAVNSGQNRCRLQVGVFSFAGRYTYCPECVREDLKKLGFSYWRRNFPTHVTVCAAHNVVLISACPHCDAPFSSKGHNLDVMWRTCAGRHLGSAESVVNQDADALKRAQFVEALCAVDSYIPSHSAAVILSEKLRRLNGLSRQRNFERKSILKRLDQIMSHLEKKEIETHVSHLEFFSEEIYQAILFAYNKLEDFLDDFSDYDQDLIPIEALWRNYGLGEYATACRA